MVEGTIVIITPLFSPRLHHTEEKSKVHGCINSNKFLVANGNILKVLKQSACWDLPIYIRLWRGG